MKGKSMNQYKKAVNKAAVVLVVLMILSTTAFAADARASSRIDRATATLSVTSSGDLYVYFTVLASGTMDTLGANKIDIQRQDGSRWITEETLTTRDYPEIQTSNAARHSATVTYTPDYTGATYRVVVTAYAKDSSGSSTSQATSSQVRT